LRKTIPGKTEQTDLFRQMSADTENKRRDWDQQFRFIHHSKHQVE